MLLISCFLLLISELRNTVSPLVPPADEGNLKVAIDLSLKTKTLCPASFSKSLLFVSTVDGTLTCLNAKTGQSLWSFDLNEPLLSSTISPVKNEDVWSQSQIVPSLDGNLYKWNGKYVESLSMSTEFLLGQMKKLPDGSFVVGGTNVAIYGIDMETGKVLYESSGRGCKPVRKGKINDRDIISLRRSQHRVRAVERTTGHENWNYSVGRYEIELADDDIDLNIDKLCDGDTINLHFSVQDGIITNTGTSTWSFKLNSPITDAWQLDNKILKSVDIFKHGLFESLQDFSEEEYQKQFFMYLGVHEGQMYIQKAVDIKDNLLGNHKAKPLEIDVDLSEWRPYISTPSRTPTLNNKKRSTELSTVDYPYDNGYVLVSNITPTALSLVKNKENSTEEGEIEIEGVMLKERWKEILVLSILIAVGINIGVKFLNKKCTRKLSALQIEDPSVKERFSSQELTVIKSKRDRYVSSKNSILQVSENHLSFSTSYDSRYMDDFEHHECLGKGGFGVVFRATKKIDDCEYAIKRIYLPRCDEAKAKMMREVKALAALDHQNIVRYFHAWWEEPPQDWQKTTDKQYLMKDYANSASYALSQDWVLEVDRVSENCSHSKSPRTSKEKRISDDPLGKRYNFDTGLESYTTDHSEFDLLKHNDVFYPDEDEPTSNSMNNQNEDSFDIVFESNGGSGNPSHSCVDILNDSKNSYTNSFDTSLIDNSILDESDIRSNELTSEKSEKNKRKKKLICKCCAQNSFCLTQPPLFLYIQMQLCKQETLKDWLKSKVDGIHLSEGMGVFMQIVDAVVYFHNLGLMHRDLKPANIMFSLDGHVKVGDFGLVTAITQPSIGKHHGQTFGDDNHTGQVGTQLYMSPEQILGKPYCHKVDIYSLGLIFFELVCPFSTQMERMQVIYKLKQGTMVDKLLDTPQGKLVQILTDENPDLRPEAKDIRTHQLIAEINNNIVNTKGVLSLNDSGIS